MPSFRSQMMGLALICTLSASPFSASAQMNSAQLQALQQEYSAAATVLYIDDRCALLDSSVRLAAQEIQAGHGAIFAQANLNASIITDAIETQLSGQSCADISENALINNSKNFMDIKTGQMLLAWETHFLANPPGEETNCAGYPMGEYAQAGVKRQKYLIDAFRNSKVAAQWSPQTARYRSVIQQVCNATTNLLQARAHPMFKLGSHAWDIGIKTRPAARYGLQVYRVNYPDEVQAYRWTSPDPEYRVDIPWAIVQDVREEIKEAEGTIGEYFLHESTLHFGFLQDQSFVVTVQPPTFAEFKSDVFEKIIITNATSGHSWTLVKRTQRYDVAQPPDETNDKYAKPHATFQMAPRDSAALKSALSAGNDISLQVVRNEKGQRRVVNTDKVNIKDFPKALAYAFAREITF